MGLVKAYGKSYYHTLLQVLPVFYVIWHTLIGQSAVHSQGYNYALMGLSVTCDFEWGLCGWNQETAPLDQCDWRRQRGVAGNGWFKIQGDHTPGKDAHGYFLFLDAADCLPKPRPPSIPMDPDLIDSFEQPEPDEILAQQMGVASSSRLQPPLTGRLQDPPPRFNRTHRKWQKSLTGKFLHHHRPRPAALTSGYPYNQRQGISYNNYNYYPDTMYPSSASYPVKNQYATGRYVPPVNTDTNSDTKPYDLPATGGYNSAGQAAPDPRDLAGMPVAPPMTNPFNMQPNNHVGHMPAGGDTAQPYTAHLMGPRIETPVNLTLTFWYHMRGNNLGRLTLYRKVLARPDQIIWEKTGQQHSGFQWIEAHVALQRGSYQLLFEGTINSAQSAGAGAGYIALDDIQLDREAELPLLNSPSYVNPATPPPHPASAAQLPISHYNGYIPVDTTVSTHSTRTITSTTPPPTTTPTTMGHPFLLPNWSISPEGYLVFPKFVPETTRAPMTSRVTSTIAMEGHRTPEGAAGTKAYIRMTPRILSREEMPMVGRARMDNGGRHEGNALLPLDHTEISAVIKPPPDDGFNQTKLFIIIASCFGAAGVLAIIAFIVKHGKSGVYSLIPCLRHRLDTMPVTPRASYVRRPRHPPPPPPVAPRQFT
ncbi:uncharacterized protein LOC129595246 [Paramacrobiotus metropolitanus]|uniref:uncharacterized protein LOC129595246 n=1 Tax=Paramacrobiotus metropolitanus TaxID=2943436 RepID=UPI0024465875|nr:uncharacterized protein LOC129595246 [Paramacrobiotus metropolitanus]